MNLSDIFVVGRWSLVELGKENVLPLSFLSYFHLVIRSLIHPGYSLILNIIVDGVCTRFFLCESNEMAIG